MNPLFAGGGRHRRNTSTNGSNAPGKDLVVSTGDAPPVRHHRRRSSIDKDATTPSNISGEKRNSIGRQQRQLSPPPPTQQQRRQGIVAAPTRTPTTTPLANGNAGRRSNATSPASRLERKGSFGPEVSNSQFPSSTNALLKRLRKHVIRTPSGDVIRGFFDNAFSIRDESIEAIMSTLNKKNRWGSDKSRIQEMVISSLRDTISTFISESKVLREKCLMQEAYINGLLRDVYDEFQNLSDISSARRINDENMLGAIARLEEDLAEARSAVIRAPSLDGVQQQQQDDDRYASGAVGGGKSAGTERGAAADEDGSAAAKKVAALEEQVRTLTREKERAMREKEEVVDRLTKEFDQKLDQTESHLKLELFQLKFELDRKKNDAERINNERQLLSRKKGELHDEMVLINSKLREADTAVMRYAKDIERLTSELNAQKDAASAKDADWRSTINSLNDIHKHAVEEKNTLRSELASCQSRIQSLEDERLSATVQLAARKEEVGSLGRDLQQARDKIAGLEARLASKDAEASANKDALMMLEVEKELRQRCEVREEAERRERIAAFAQLMAIQTECTTKVAEVEAKRYAEVSQLQRDYDNTRREKEEAQQNLVNRTDEIMGLQSEIQELHSALSNAPANKDSVEQLGKVTGELEVVRRQLKEMQEQQIHRSQSDSARIGELEEKLKLGEAQRRKLHNLVQELRGNIRVYARVRPYLPNDGLDLNKPPDPTITARVDVNSLRIARRRKNEDTMEEFNFTFDKVFGPASSQEAVFAEVSEFVQSALDGYHVCLFSYGQTGSGKTHTMQGSGNGSMRGIIPRAMQQVGKYKQELEMKGWEYQMEVSFLEIYNENIRDLLRSGNPAYGEDLPKHDIKKDAQGNIYVTDITMQQLDPNSARDVERIMENAARNRSVGQTAMNEVSSRSHSVFALHLRATNRAQGIVLKGALNLVDLAGSERLDRSQVKGSQLKETVAINKSLSALTDVFVAIGNRQGHIPFRNSKLTYLLQQALSGDGKTLMMVNLSPTEESFQESLSSLRIAKQVNQCELGKPKKDIGDAGSSLNRAASSLASSGGNNGSGGGSSNSSSGGLGGMGSSHSNNNTPTNTNNNNRLSIASDNGSVASTNSSSASGSRPASGAVGRGSNEGSGSKISSSTSRPSPNNISNSSSSSSSGGAGGGGGGVGGLNSSSFGGSSSVSTTARRGMARSHSTVMPASSISISRTIARDRAAAAAAAAASGIDNSDSLSVNSAVSAVSAGSTASSSTTTAAAAAAGGGGVSGSAGRISLMSRSSSIAVRRSPREAAKSSSSTSSSGFGPSHSSGKIQKTPKS